VAGVLVDEDNIKKLSLFNIQDSKKLNDSTIEKVALQIKANSIFSVVVINPLKYNELYSKFLNLNNLLAWGHARAIENILEKKPCQNALSDKFGNESLIKNALMKKGRTINLEQRTKAESDLAVAAASILARNEFVQRMKKLSREYGMDFQKGASQKVKEQATEFISKYGFESLKNIAKLHFKTTKELNIE
jgi:ribonuclease HIII